MKGRVLILRPEPGASASATKARALGLEPIVAPLFTVKPVAWNAPDPAGFDALLLTSANVARFGGEQLRLFLHLPSYAVGEASAEAAREAGFGAVQAGPGDGAAALEMMAEDGIRSAFHPCGRDHVALTHPAVRIERRIVYEAEPAQALPPAAGEAIEDGALILVHSPRAGALLASLVRDRGKARIAAISEKAAETAGEGWRDKAVAAIPRDEALLELAAKLCQTGDPRGAGADRW